MEDHRWPYQPKHSPSNQFHTHYNMMLYHGSKRHCCITYRQGKLRTRVYAGGHNLVIVILNESYFKRSGYGAESRK